MTLWRGSRLVAAVWITTDVIDRVFDVWAPGARVFALHHGFLVVLAAPVRQACEVCLGMPFVNDGGVLRAGPHESPENRGRIPVAEDERPTKSGVSRGYPGSAEGFSAASGGRLVPPLAPDRPADRAPERVSLPWQGALEEHSLGALEEIAPHTWIDLEVGLCMVAPLGAPPAPLPRPAEPALRATFGQGPPDPRAIAVAEALEGPPRPRPAAPPVARAAKGLLDWLTARRAGTGTGLLARLFGRGRAAEGVGGGSSGGGWLSRLFGWMGSGTSGAPGAGALGGGTGGVAGGGAGGGASVGGPSWLSRLFGRVFGGSPGVGGSAGVGGTSAASAPTDTPAGRALAPAPSWLERMARRLAAPLIAPMLDRQHNQYMTDLLDLFDQGALDEALRRAIPLGTGLGPPLPPALTLPKPRSDLTLRFDRSSAASSIGSGPDVHALLRQTYTRAAEKLVAEGRFEDAAFVYVELLKDARAAVDLLDRHEKWTLAAEIATAAGLGPEVAARLYARAGQLDRAVSIARRTGSFAVCLPVIEAVDKERGRAFRAIWAGHLAAGGDPAGAVGVSWPDPELRPLALRWLDDALAVGGVAGARLLPLRLTATPDRYDDVRAEVEALLTGDTLDDVAARLALADGLAEQLATSPGARTLGRALTRRLLVDQAAHPAIVRADAARKLAPGVVDPAFAVDLPPLADAPPLRDLVTHRVDPSDRGSAPVYDVALLPRGRVLVALGEIGVHLYTRDGRLLAVFDEPAEELVVHEAGTRAIAVARRGDNCRLARLDLVANTVTRWFDATLGPVTRTFDGSLWFVADGSAVLALDPNAERPTTVWRVDTRGPVVGLRRGAGLTVHVGGQAPEIWRYTFPNLRLDERAMAPEDPWQVATLGHDGGLYEALPARTGEGGHVLPVRLCRRGSAVPTNLLLPVPGEVLPHGVDSAGRLVVWAHDRVLVYVDNLLRLDLDRRRGGAIHGRLTDDLLVVGDALGRVDAYDLRVGTRVAHVRV